ncbi:MAG TPA: DMT family transporter [Actinomycetota bacterium]|nr:DMT family transporter [Actinomycetota bacterium]
MTTPSANARGIVLASVAAVAFGTLAIFAKLGYDDGAGLLPLLAARFLVAVVLLAAYHIAIRRPLWVGRRDVVRLMLLGGVGYAAESALFFLGLERAPAAVISLVFFTYPTWTSLLGFVTRMEPYSHRTVASLALGSAGIALIFSLRLESLAGPLFALLAAMSLAVYLLVAQIVMARVEASVAATWTATGALVAFSGATLVTGSGLPRAAFDEAAALGAATAVAFVLLYRAIELIGFTRTAVASMLEPVATIVLAALLLDEAITGRVVLGAVLVVAALPVLALAPRGAEPELPPPAGP